MKKIAILHTSFVFVSVEPIINELIEARIPDAEVLHFVDSDVLATVVREQRISDRSEARMVHLAEAAEAAGADIIFSACSSLGPALDAAAHAVTTPVVKIDEAMTSRAVDLGARIGVLATVPTTLPPTAALLRKHASERGKRILVEERLAEGAFDILMSGDRARHDALVTEQAIALAADVEVIVLAQASMNRLQPELARATGLPVLASPEMGVEYLAQQLEALAS